jgi:hypothetical protein
MRRVGVLPEYAMSEAFALTGPDADSIVVAEQKAQMNQIDAAINAYQAAADRAAGDKSANARSAHYLKSRLQELKWQKQFEAGGWVDVQPKDAEMPGWEVVGGKWSVEKNGTLVGVADDNGLMLTFAGTFLAPRFEIDGGMELPPPKPPVRAVYFGVSMSAAQPTKYAGWYLVRRPDKVDVYSTWIADFHREIPIQDQNVVNVTQFDDKVVGRLNGHMTANVGSLGELTGPEVYIALGSPGTPLGTEVRLKNLRVRKLTEAPPQQ